MHRRTTFNTSGIYLVLLYIFTFRSGLSCCHVIFKKCCRAVSVEINFKVTIRSVSNDIVVNVSTIKTLQNTELIKCTVYFVIYSVTAKFGIITCRLHIELACRVASFGVCATVDLYTPGVYYKTVSERGLIRMLLQYNTPFRVLSISEDKYF